MRPRLHLAATPPEVHIGDWVRPYSRGVWRVFRILEGFNELRYSLAEPKVRSKRRVVFSKRLVNDSWKRSFATESSEIGLVEPVNHEERQRIDDLLASNPTIKTAFEKYEAHPKPIDLVLNLTFGGKPGFDRTSFRSDCDSILAGRLVSGLTLDEVLQLLAPAPSFQHYSRIPVLATLQLVSPDHELRDSDFVFRSYRVLDF